MEPGDSQDEDLQLVSLLAEGLAIIRAMKRSPRPAVAEANALSA